MSKLFDELVKKRRLSADFLRPRYEDLADASELPDMDKTAKRIKKAVVGQEKVLVYGDYDADGVTASVLLHDALRMAGLRKIDVMLPDRFADGYGMSERLVERAVHDKIDLVVTVDCGSRDGEIVSKLQGRGIDVVVTDHHECGEDLPSAVAVVNPKRPDVQVPADLRDLAGVGVAFMVARGLVDAGLIKAGQEKWLLDLVVIGTICDSMPMSLENRRLCFYGMKVLEKTRRVGLQELMRVSGVKNLNSHAIGFQLGPRLNAAGRMDTPEIALKLLMAASRPEAAELAAKLEEYNQLRKTQQKEALDEIKEQGMVGRQPVIVVKGRWHEGIIGIVAGQLTERYHKPAFTFTETPDGWKGSGRSFGDFSLAEALEACEDLIERGGGHAAACGVSVPKGGIEQFTEGINQHYEALALSDQKHFWHKDADVVADQTDDLSLELVEEVQQLEPYGEGNEEPVWKLEKVFIQSARKLGADQNHLCLIVRDDHGNTMKLIAFYAPKDWLLAEEGQRVDAWFTLMENEWNGLRSVEGRLVKLMPRQEF